MTSELLHCLTAFPDPWPLAKITIDLEKPGQWVTKMARLYFSDDCARRTDRIPNKTRGTAVEAAMEETEHILPKLEARMIPGNIGGTSAPPLFHAPKRLLVPRNLPWPQSYSIIWQIGIIR